MTIDEAIKWLKAEASYIEADVGNGKEILEAYEMAIKALEQQPCDCISREEVLAKIDEERKHLLTLKMDGAEHIVVHHARRIIEDMPPVTPQLKVGKWLEKEINSDKVIEEWQSARCSKCNLYHTTPYMYYFSHYDYCPHCGCRMKGEDNERRKRCKCRK